MFCTNCGTQLPDDAKFCSNCGAPTHGTPSGSGSATQPERIYTGQTETAWIEAEKQTAGLGPGLLGHFMPGVSQPLDITLTVMASGPPGTGSVPIISHGFRIWPTAIQPVEYYGSEQLGDGPAILRELTEDLIGYGFQLVDTGPFWFQRRFEREYRPGEIDYSDNTPLEERRQEEDRAYREEQRRLYRAGDIRYQKSMWIAYILFFFLGWAGGHRFYLNRVWSGVTQLILSTAVGLIFVWMGSNLQRSTLDDPNDLFTPQLIVAVSVLVFFYCFY